MKNDILTAADALSDTELLARLPVLAGTERHASVELVAHLAALLVRPAAYAAQGYGSLFGYCVGALCLSEDAACTRTRVARACRRFPVLLDLLADGSMSLTSVRRLGRLLTKENYQDVLVRAKRRSRREIDALVAELDPQPDLKPSVRKLPNPSAPPASSSPARESASDQAPTVLESSTPVTSEPAVPVVPATPRPVIQASAPERYRVQFTIGEKTHETLRRLQDLLRREVPSGDPAVIVDRALTLLLEKVEKAKLGTATKPRTGGAIRSGTDARPGPGGSRPSRHLPRAVTRAVSERDGDQCAYVSPDGRRCTERTYLEFHHIHPYAKHGPPTVENISLRCRRHNQYEAELVFGPRGTSRPNEGQRRDDMMVAAPHCGMRPTG